MPQLIALTGPKRVGKTTLANALAPTHKIVSFAEPIRRILEDLDPQIGHDLFLSTLLETGGWPLAKQTPRVRKMMQDIGTSIRARLGDSIFTTAAVCRIQTHMAEGHNVVVDDLRFAVEASALKGLDAEIWLLHRPGVEYTREHASEIPLPGHYIDRHIYL